MFAACMLFQVLYVFCLVLWAFFADLNGHTMLTSIFPGFKLLNVYSFFYGLIASGLYGWFVAIIFTFFFNVWPSFVRAIGAAKS